MTTKLWQNCPSWPANPWLRNICSCCLQLRFGGWLLCSNSWLIQDSNLVSLILSDDVVPLRLWLWFLFSPQKHFWSVLFPKEQRGRYWKRDLSLVTLCILSSCFRSSPLFWQLEKAIDNNNYNHSRNAVEFFEEVSGRLLHLHTPDSLRG